MGPFTLAQVRRRQSGFRAQRLQGGVNVHNGIEVSQMTIEGGSGVLYRASFPRGTSV